MNFDTEVLLEVQCFIHCSSLNKLLTQKNTAQYNFLVSGAVIYNGWMFSQLSLLRKCTYVTDFFS